MILIGSVRSAWNQQQRTHMERKSSGISNNGPTWKENSQNPNEIKIPIFDCLSRCQKCTGAKGKFFKSVGIKGFDFSNLNECKDGKNKHINFLHLPQHLWPGDWREQLRQLNDNIEKNQQGIVFWRTQKGY